MIDPRLHQLKQAIFRYEDDFLYWVDVFLHEYGMNFEDFKKLPIPTFYLLRGRIIKRYEEQNKGFEKIRGRKK